MLNIELTLYGVDDTLKEIREDLNSVLGSNISKKRKDEIIYKTIGSVKTLWRLIYVSEEDTDKDEEESGFLI